MLLNTYRIAHIARGLEVDLIHSPLIEGRKPVKCLRPLEFRLDVSEIFIRRDLVTEDVVLYRKSTDWQGLLDVAAW